MKRVGRLVIFAIAFIFISNLIALADIPSRSSKVYVRGKQLIVEKRLEDNSLAQAKPYIIKGVTWSPATKAPDKGPNPNDPDQEIPYGFFFDWPGRVPQGHDVLRYWLESEFVDYYRTDIGLLKKMNANTVRVYDFTVTNYELAKEVLDELYRNGIMIIITVASAKEDIDSKRYAKIVRRWRNHPAVLMWSLGNEWNLDYNRYWGYETVADAAKGTEKAAYRIKRLDPNHPVSSCLGDRFEDEDYDNTIGYIVNTCPSVDVWGINVYRGRSFFDLFEDWQRVSSKPFYISEFGTDSFYTTKCHLVNKIQADSCMGKTNNVHRAQYIMRLWKEITPHLSALYPDQACLGGLVHEFNDSLWKVGSYHVGLGGLVNYYSEEAQSYAEQNTEGTYLPGSHHDDVSNEEYYGVVDFNRKPKKIYWSLKEYYQQLGE